MEELNLNDPRILSAAEASFLWGIDDSWLRKKVHQFPKGSIRRFGKQWVVTYQGMKEVFGEPQPKQEYTREEILKLYEITQEAVKQQGASTTAEKIVFATQFLYRKGVHKTLAVVLAEAVCDIYDFELLLNIFAKEERIK
jgi:Helix-turn-helix domain